MKKLTVFVNDLRSEFLPDSFAERILEDTAPSWLSARLLALAKNALCGFNGAMALELADNLVDCWSYGVCHYTRIGHVDKMLNSMYNKILYCAEQRGIQLPGHF